MHDDISVAGARELSQLAFPGACLVLGLLITAISWGGPADNLLAIGGLLVGMALWSLVASRLWLHLGLATMFAGLAWFTGSAGLLLFALCPLAYLMLRLRPAHVFVVVYSLTPTAAYLARTGDAHLALTMFLPLGVGSIVVSFFSARWILRMRGLTRELATMQERQRLAGEIHDTVAQGLSSVVMLLEAAREASPDVARKHIDLAVQTARENMHEARALVGALTPVPLATTSLTDALQRLSARFGARFALAGDSRALPVSTEVVVLRVAQEALNNVQRHAHASEVSVSLGFEPSLVALEVRDDGVGFEADPQVGYGLGGMRGRVEQTGGRLTIHSGQSGTLVRAEVPA